MRCDSIVNLNLFELMRVHPDTNFITACDNYIWFGQTLTSSGIYETIVQNSIGCDSPTQDIC